MIRLLAVVALQLVCIGAMAQIAPKDGTAETPPGSATPQPAPQGPMLDRPDAFERSFAVSFYRFDACGDPLAGRMFRRALADKFAHCPFSAAARSRYQERSRAQQAKAQSRIQGMIESQGGLPLRMEGMSLTCNEQRVAEDYKISRARLEQYVQGAVSADAVIEASCDAADITP